MEYWKISDFKDEVGKHTNTVDGWFKRLEEHGVHHVNRVHGEKVYDTYDLEIALWIKERREKKWSLDAIIDDIKNHFEVRPFPIGEEPQTPLDMDNLKHQLVEEMRGVVKEEMKEQMAEHQRSIENRLEERDRLLMETLQAKREPKRTWLDRLFRK